VLQLDPQGTTGGYSSDCPGQDSILVCGALGSQSFELFAGYICRAAPEEDI